MWDNEINRLRTRASDSFETGWSAPLTNWWRRWNAKPNTKWVLAAERRSIPTGAGMKSGNGTSSFGFFDCNTFIASTIAGSLTKGSKGLHSPRPENLKYVPVRVWLMVAYVLKSSRNSLVWKTVGLTNCAMSLLVMFFSCRRWVITSMRRTALISLLMHNLSYNRHKIKCKHVCSIFLIAGMSLSHSSCEKSPKTVPTFSKNLCLSEQRPKNVCISAKVGTALLSMFCLKK